MIDSENTSDSDDLAPDADLPGDTGSLPPSLLALAHPEDASIVPDKVDNEAVEA